MSKQHSILAQFVLASTVVAIGGCASNPSSEQKYSPTKNDPITAISAAPREGWATDPHLSYNLFSYYPMNFYNNTLYGSMGLYGINYY